MDIQMEWIDCTQPVEQDDKVRQVDLRYVEKESQQIYAQILQDQYCGELANLHDDPVKAEVHVIEKTYYFMTVGAAMENVGKLVDNLVKHTKMLQEAVGSVTPKEKAYHA